MNWRCRLGRHRYARVPFTWVETFPGCKSGFNGICVRCGKDIYLSPPRLA